MVVDDFPLKVAQSVFDNTPVIAAVEVGRFSVIVEPEPVAESAGPEVAMVYFPEVSVVPPMAIVDDPILFVAVIVPVALLKLIPAPAVKLCTPRFVSVTAPVEAEAFKYVEPVMVVVTYELTLALPLKVFQSAADNAPVTEAVEVAKAKVWTSPEEVITSAGPEEAKVWEVPV